MNKEHWNTSIVNKKEDKTTIVACIMKILTTYMNVI